MFNIKSRFPSCQLYCFMYSLKTGNDCWVSMNGELKSSGAVISVPSPWQSPIRKLVETRQANDYDKHNSHGDKVGNRGRSNSVPDNRNRKRIWLSWFGTETEFLSKYWKWKPHTAGWSKICQLISHCSLKVQRYCCAVRFVSVRLVSAGCSALMFG